MSLARLAADSGAPASVCAETTGNQHAAARAMDATALANYGVTAARLDDLEDALDHYSEKIGSPRAATVKRRVRTLSLEDLFDKLRAVHSRLDRLSAFPPFRLFPPFSAFFRLFPPFSAPPRRIFSPPTKPPASSSTAPPPKKAPKPPRHLSPHSRLILPTPPHSSIRNDTRKVAVAILIMLHKSDSNGCN